MRYTHNRDERSKKVMVVGLSTVVVFVLGGGVSQLLTTHQTQQLFPRLVNPKNLSQQPFQSAERRRTAKGLQTSPIRCGCRRYAPLPQEPLCAALESKRLRGSCSEL